MTVWRHPWEKENLMLSCVSMFFRICHRISSCLQPVACFIAFLPGEHVFLQVTPVACFPAFVIGCLFFPRLSLVACFSRVCHWFLVFPRLSLLSCFPAFVIACMISRNWHRFSRAWYRLFVLPDFKLNTYFPALCTVCKVWFPGAVIGSFFRLCLLWLPSCTCNYRSLVFVKQQTNLLLVDFSSGWSFRLCIWNNRVSVCWTVPELADNCQAIYSSVQAVWDSAASVAHRASSLRR